MFTAAALVTLAEQGKIKLDAPIGNYVKGLFPKLSALTAHQLLTHTAGLRDEGNEPIGLHDDSALASYVLSWKDNYFFTDPGKIYSYSNPGFRLAGFVVQEISGKPYADVMEEIIFKPLGMDRTTLRPTLAMTYPFSQGHDGADKTAVVRPIGIAIGTLCSVLRLTRIIHEADSEHDARMCDEMFRGNSMKRNNDEATNLYNGERYSSRSTLVRSALKS
jgi:CubicO group peptidase (beta-lactamase class C family)